MRDLHDKLSLVTGAAGGIGRAIAVALAHRGARIVACDVDAAGLASLASSLGSRLALAERVDVSDEAGMRALAGRVHRELGPLDLLVNNAGVGLAGGILDTSLEDLQWVLRVNLFGVLHGCHFFVPRMVEAGPGRHVVNIASGLGLVAAPGILGYVASKFAVVGLSESMWTELSPHGIGVSVVCPGIIDTGIIATTRLSGRPEGVRQRIQAMYRKRNYPPEKVAEAVLAAVQKRRFWVPVTPEVHMLWSIKRLVPGALKPIARLMQRRIVGE